MSTCDLQVLVVDDHPAFRSAAVAVIEATEGFVLAAVLGDRDEVLRWDTNAGSRADLVLMDINLGDDDGVALTHELRKLRPGIDVVLVSTLHPADLPPDAVTCGARGFLPKVQLGPAALLGIVSGVYDWR